MTATNPVTDGAQHAAGDAPVVNHYNRPVAFYAASVGVSWVTWFIAAYLSHLPDQAAAVRVATAALGLIGLAAPVGVAAWLVRRDAVARADIRGRLLWPRNAPIRYVVLSVVLLPVSLLAAQAVSLAFGYSADQFAWRGGFTFTSGLLPVWLTLTLAPLLEELAWHGYGTDALVRRMRLISASLLFAVVWTLWHVPLAFIEGYYQAEVVEEGWLHTLNFPLSMIPFVLLMNWLYYRAGRSIAVAVVFHLGANLSAELWMTHPDTKIIQTALLLVVTAVVVVRERRLFFDRPLGTDTPAVTP